MISNTEALFKMLSHGVYVIAVSDGIHQNAFTASWVMQVSFNPLLLAISINPEHYSYLLLKAGGVCTVNVLGQDQIEIVKHFARSDIKDKMAGFDWRQGKNAAPVLAESLAFFDCKVSHYTEAGDHKIAVCNVIDGAVLKPVCPLLYSQTDDMDGSSSIYNQYR